MKDLVGFKYRTKSKEEVFRLIKNGAPIDLIKIFELEICLLRLSNNPYAIARYIYIRLGELFQYNNHLEYATEEKRKEIRNKKIDKNHVTDFNFVCDGYVSLYVELLLHFGIAAKEVNTKDHVYVVYTIEEKTYLADLTSGNEDITRIKFGLKPIYNRQILPFAPKIDTTFDDIDQIIYINGITTEEVLENIKNELNKRQEQEKWNREEYIYQVFKIVENIMNFERNSIGFVSGVTFIYYLLDFFIENYEICNIHFLNQNNGLEIEIFSIIRDKKNCHFIYQETEKGFYQLQEISKIDLLNIVNEKKLKLVKNKGE